MEFYNQVMTAAEYLRGQTDLRPTVGVILGSGLGSLADRIQDAEAVLYRDIPGFPRSQVQGHAARLVFGRVGETAVAAMQGRFHFYEGYSMKELCLPVYVLRELGVKDLIVTNACGGINRSFAPGDLMLITDHINLTGQSPLNGPNDERFGPRFPDMSAAYDPALRAFAAETAARQGTGLRQGVYAFYAGPSFETAADVHRAGGDHCPVSGPAGSGAELYHQHGHRHFAHRALPCPGAGHRRPGRGAVLRPGGGAAAHLAGGLTGAEKENRL